MTQIIPHQRGVFSYPKKYPISGGYFHTSKSTPSAGGTIFLSAFWLRSKYIVCSYQLNFHTQKVSHQRKVFPYPKKYPNSGEYFHTPKSTPSAGGISIPQKIPHQRGVFLYPKKYPNQRASSQGPQNFGSVTSVLRSPC